MKDKQQTYFVNIGSSSLLVIFLVLCLVTFAILSLSSARSDYSFSERLAEHKQAYYDASAKAEVIVDEIDRVLYEVSGDIDLSSQDDSADAVSDPAAFWEYLENVGETLSTIQMDGIVLQLDSLTEEGIVSFQVPAGRQQALSVRLQILNYKENENYYEIKTWKIVSTDSWESEQPLNLMPVVP